MTSPPGDRERVVRELHSKYCDLDACYFPSDPCAVIDAIELAYDAGRRAGLEEAAQALITAFPAGDRPAVSFMVATVRSLLTDTKEGG